MRKLNLTVYVSILLGAVFAGSCFADPSEGHHHHSNSREAPTVYPDRIVVTWEGNPATTFSVTWRTAPDIDTGIAQIAVAKASPKFSRTAQNQKSEVTALRPSQEHQDENVAANYHSVTFGGLKPDTLYAYRVGGQGYWSEWIHVRTASRETKPFSFIYLGDAQNGIRSHWSRAIRAAYTKASPDTDFILHAGDLVNRAHRNLEWDQWHRAGGWIQRMLPNIAIPGNHEYSDGLSIHWRPQFEFPEHGVEGLEETVYHIDYQGARIIALNSNTRIKAQAEWLEEVLAKNPNRWTLVTHHHPIFASAESRDNEKLRKLWKPLYEKYHVDLVMQGHDHTYARGREINLEQAVNVKDAETGTVYVNSVSGAKMYSVRPDRWEAYDAKMERSAENTQLFQLIRIEGKRLKFRAYTVTGELYDAFDLVKENGKERNRIIDQTPDSPERTHENTLP